MMGRLKGEPYVKRGKTDPGDAAAICEAVTRPTMSFVPIKGVDSDPALLKNGRQLSAWIGIVPDNDSTGGKVTQTAGRRPHMTPSQAFRCPWLQDPRCQQQT